MRLLVTGGCGFIGSNVIRQLLDRSEVATLVNLDCLTYAGNPENLAGIESERYVFEQVDIRDKEEVHRVVVDRDITHVMHLAAESHVDRSIATPGDFILTNVVGTYHLLEACRHAWEGRFSECRFLHVSTDEVYGSLGTEGTFTEESPHAPNSPYSASKSGADMLVRSYHRTYGFPAVTTNCSNNFGPYQHPEKLVPVVIRCLLERCPIPVYGDGSNVRDWIFVADHVDGLWRALQRGRVGETYNLGGGGEWPNLRMVETICDLVDELAPELGGGSRELVSFVTDRPGHDFRYAVDSGKARRELEWKPAHSFAEGLRKTVAWYLSHGDWMRRARLGK